MRYFSAFLAMLSTLGILAVLGLGLWGRIGLAGATLAVIVLGIIAVASFDAHAYYLDVDHAPRQHPRQDYDP